MGQGQIIITNGERQKGKKKASDLGDVSAMNGFYLNCPAKRVCIERDAILDIYGRAVRVNHFVFEY